MHSDDNVQKAMQEAMKLLNDVQLTEPEQEFASEVGAMIFKVALGQWYLSGGPISGPRRVAATAAIAFALVFAKYADQDMTQAPPDSLEDSLGQLNDHFEEAECREIKELLAEVSGEGITDQLRVVVEFLYDHKDAAEKALDIESGELNEFLKGAELTVADAERMARALRLQLRLVQF